MEKAVVIGASGGIGAAVSDALRGRGVQVAGLSRSIDGLDVTDEDSIAHHLGRLDGTFDLIFVATGALVIDGARPEKSIRALAMDPLIAQFRLNAAGPALVLKHALPLIPRDRRATFAVLSARVGSIGDNRLGGWHGYRAAKAALNQLMHGAAVELARTHRHAIVACLHPGTVETGFTADYPEHDKLSPAQSADRLLDVLDGLTPDRTGGFWDYAGREVPW